MDSKENARRNVETTGGDHLVVEMPNEEAGVSVPSTEKNKSPLKTVKDSSFELAGMDNQRSQAQLPNTTPTSSLETSRFRPTPNRPPKVPTETLTRRKTLARSAYSKPKSRFVEPTVSILSALVDDVHPLPVSSSPCMLSPSNNKKVSLSESQTPKEGLRDVPIMPKTSFLASPGGDDEEEDEEIFKIESAAKKIEKSRRKWKVVTVSEWVVLVCIWGVLIASLTVRKLNHCMLWGSEIGKWCVLVMVIVSGHLMVKWFTHVSVFVIEQNFLLKNKVLYFIYGVKKSVRVFLWLGLVLLTWALLINRGVKRSEHATDILNKVSRGLTASLVGALIWMIKTLLVKLLATNFQCSRFFDRIQESLFHQYVLKTLSGPPVMQLAEATGTVQSTGQLCFPSTRKEGKSIEQEVMDVNKLHKLKQEKVSAWTMKSLVNVITTSGLSTITNEIDQMESETAEQKDNEITNELEAKAAADKIFKNVAKPHTKYIDIVDLLRLLSKEEVDNVLPLFEGAVELGKIKKSAVKNWVMIVEEMNILTTIFLKFDNEKVYYPNSVLATKPISNFYRSPDMGDSVEFAVDVSTTVESLGALKARIKGFIESKPQHWRAAHSVVVKEIENLNKMKMVLFVTHTMNYQNYPEKSCRRTDLVIEMKKIFEQLSIKYHLLPQEVHLSYVGSAATAMTNVGRS